MPKKTAKRLTAKRLTTKRNKTMKSNPWATHVHMCMEKYGLTYKQASQNGKCRNLYYLGHE